MRLRWTASQNVPCSLQADTGVRASPPQFKLSFAALRGMLLHCCCASFGCPLCRPTLYHAAEGDTRVDVLELLFIRLPAVMAAHQDARQQASDLDHRTSSAHRHARKKPQASHPVGLEQNRKEAVRTKTFRKSTKHSALSTQHSGHAGLRSHESHANPGPFRCLRSSSPVLACPSAVTGSFRP